MAVGRGSLIGVLGSDRLSSLTAGNLASNEANWASSCSCAVFFKFIFSTFSPLIF